MKAKTMDWKQYGFALIVLGLIGYQAFYNGVTEQPIDGSAVLQEQVISQEGIVLPIVWGDIGQKLVHAGVIDEQKIIQLYEARGKTPETITSLLFGNENKSITITPENANEILNILWAFGLANKTPILSEGPMMDEQYGGADRFASTGGWSLARGNAMEHYNAYEFVTLSQEQGDRVERVAKNIYRPCCDNSTYFPDCNHGMAMLGLLELMAAQNVSEADMYRIALQVNAYWFPSTYVTLASYFNDQGIAWSEVDPQLVLGAEYSSGTGYRNILSKITPANIQGGGSCGV